MDDTNSKNSKPLQYYMDIIECLLQELQHIENILDILNVGYESQYGQEWSQSSTHVLIGYIRQVRMKYETELSAGEIEK